MCKREEADKDYVVGDKGVGVKFMMIMTTSAMTVPLPLLLTMQNINIESTTVKPYLTKSTTFCSICNAF